MRVDIVKFVVKGGGRLVMEEGELRRDLSEREMGVMLGEDERILWGGGKDRIGLFGW